MKNQDFNEYEKEKKNIIDKNLSCEDYEREIMFLAERLNI